MRAVNIRSLRHETVEIMEHVARGESLEIRRRNQPVAILKPFGAENKAPMRPDFRRRLRAIYGDQLLPETGTELLAEERGDR